MIEGDARYRKSRVGDLASGQRASSAIGNWSGCKKQRAVQEVWMEIQNQYGGRERILLSLFLLLCVWRCQKKKKKKKKRRKEKEVALVVVLLRKKKNKKKGGVHVHNQTTPASVPSISLTSFPLFQAPSPSSPPSFNPPARPPSHPLLRIRSSQTHYILWVTSTIFFSKVCLRPLLLTPTLRALLSFLPRDPN